MTAIGLSDGLRNSDAEPRLLVHGMYPIRRCRYIVGECQVSFCLVVDLGCPEDETGHHFPIGLVERPMRALGDHTYSEVA